MPAYVSAVQDVGGGVKYGWLTDPDGNTFALQEMVRVTEPARGGHFAPFEEPELYAEELRAFLRPYHPAAATALLS